MLGENVEETKFKWRRRRVSDNVSFFKNSDEDIFMVIKVALSAE